MKRMHVDTNETSKSQKKKIETMRNKTKRKYDATKPVEGEIEENKPKSVEELSTNENANEDLIENDENFEDIPPVKPPKVHSCAECGKEFPNPAKLRRHKTIHGEKTIACNLCDRKFTCDENLRAHKKILHSEGRQAQCNLCSKVLASAFSLTYHLRNVHNVEEGSFVCHGCGKKFFNNSSLERHINISHKEQKYICEVCAKSYKDYNCFKLHVKSHDPEKEYRKCPHCKEDIWIVAYYAHVQKKHRKYYTKRNNSGFMCTVCGKTVTTREGLKNHTRTHTGERPYVCEVCGKGFSIKQFLKIHMVVHTKERPHGCSYCEKKFTQRTTLSKHLKREHANILNQTIVVQNIDFIQLQAVNSTVG